MTEVVCHVLLCETDDGLVLVDSGLGVKALQHPARMGAARFMLRVAQDESRTALRHIEEMGHHRDDVTHIVLTHMDFDHVGGIADFPGATIHTSAEEYDCAVAHPDFAARQRYARKMWDHNPKMELHGGRGDIWKYGLTGIEVLPGITMIPMRGHTKGHAAVAVDAGERGMLIHAGDAAFDASSYTDTAPSGRPLSRQPKIRAFERIMAADRKAIDANHGILARLQTEERVTVFPAHDKRILDDLLNR